MDLLEQSLSVIKLDTNDTYIYKSVLLLQANLDLKYLSIFNTILLQTFKNLDLLKFQIQKVYLFDTLNLGLSVVFCFNFLHI